MTYPYESLSPERFQEFCQALMAKEYPGFQAFPVGMPDGGRDGICEMPGLDDSADFVVFQVKFTRRPDLKDDSHKDVLETLEAELPKINTLIPRGAGKYIYLTNVSGTSHLDVGAIDKTKALLAANLTVPAHVLWRESLDRRLDSAWDIKWSYPELFTGPD